MSLPQSIHEHLDMVRNKKISYAKIFHRIGTAMVSIVMVDSIVILDAQTIPTAQAMVHLSRKRVDLQPPVMTCTHQPNC